MFCNASSSKAVNRGTMTLKIQLLLFWYQSVTCREALALVHAGVCPLLGEFPGPCTSQCWRLGPQPHYSRGPNGRRACGDEPCLPLDRPGRVPGFADTSVNTAGKRPALWSVPREPRAYFTQRQAHYGTRVSCKPELLPCFYFLFPRAGMGLSAFY